ncbi:MAG TPA: zf-HC2 domain-containing protein [Pyrinomonadaceae bacterium]|nr:zf-HC2 domain-containing protein [Pyrinomonadaceae bacterium]
MNCEKCQELLSDFLDGLLTDEEHLALSAHMEECLECFHVRRELDEIVSYCRETRGQYEAPPNERALWLRIRNTIESQPSALASGAAASGSKRNARFGLWQRWMDRQWELTLPQLAAAVSVIIIAVALGTAFSLQQVRNNSQQDSQQAAGNLQQSGSSQKLTALTSDVDERVRRQQIAIDYWYERVSQRKRRWNPQLREAFERNLSVLDQAVEDSRQRLKVNPHDDISEEMLNAALNDKMELLKEFSDQ